MAATLNATRSMMLTTDAERHQARRLSKALDGRLDGLQVIAPGRPEDGVEVPREVLDVIVELVTAMAEGRTLTVGSMPEALTTTVAADQLGISRPTLMKLIRENQIESFKVGSHTRVTAAEIKRYRKTRAALQRAAFEALRDLEDEFDIVE